jgi:16S rRNA (guanine(966)-N(2))-methyltransferase RsmD
MRITGGVYCNRKIICPPGEIRPAMDRMRESVFAILGDLSGCSFLDLFTGSGVVGIEAASRGAEPVVLVEKDARKIATIKQNISFVTTAITIKLTPVERFLKKGEKKFDYIFIDPPFRYQFKENLFRLIGESDIFSGEGYIILHLPREERKSLTITNFLIADERRYGRSQVLFFKKKEKESAETAAHREEQK